MSSTTNINPNNWYKLAFIFHSNDPRHWTSKDISKWTRSYIERELLGTYYDAGNSKVFFKRISHFEGDADVAMRKKKIITIFDLNLTIDFEVKINETVSCGSISIPEISQDLGKQNYVFNITFNGSPEDEEKSREILKKEAIPKIRSLFGSLSAVMIETHANDVYIASEDRAAKIKMEEANRSLTSVNSISATKESPKGGSKLLNTSQLSNVEEFMATAPELFQAFSDSNKLAAWTRAPVVNDFRVGGSFSFFGGNVEGKYTDISENKLIEENWRLKTWPKNHYARLKLLFEQQQSSTIVKIDWTGIPVGDEETVAQKFREFYIRTIKFTFGYGADLV